MSEEEDRSRAARVETPPPTSGNTLHWDGTGVVSQDVELTQDSEAVWKQSLYKRRP